MQILSTILENLPNSSDFSWCMCVWGVILSLGIFFYVFFILNYLLPLLVNEEYGCYVWFHWQKAYKMTASLVYQSFGVLYGDLSTSPIYVFPRTSGRLKLHESDDDIVLGVLSLVFWTLTIIPLCKYIIFVLGLGSRLQWWRCIKKPVKYFLPFFSTSDFFNW